MRKQFNLQDWLKDKSQKVETRDGRPARIICTDAKADDGACIIALIPGYGGEEAYQFFPDGRAFSSKSSDEDCSDLFIIRPEEELTEFEKRLVKFYNDRNGLPHDKDGVYSRHDLDELLHNTATELLALARKELEPEVLKRLEEAYKNQDEVVYENGKRDGKAEAMKDLPRWKKAAQAFGNYTVAPTETGEYCLLIDGRFIMLSDLAKLPKEDE